MKLRRVSKSYRLLVISFVVGATELTLELTATRIAAPYIGLTIYVWTSIIGVILASLALGYLIGGKLADKNKNPMDIVYLLLASAVFIGVVNMIKDPLLAGLDRQDMAIQLKALLSSCLLFAIPTISLGAVTPYLARLNIDGVATSGTQISRINAAGTSGALFGTFFTGFYLFSIVGSRNILGLLILLLIMTSFLFAPQKFNLYRALLCLLALLGLFAPSVLDVGGVVKDFDSAYNRYFVRDTGPVRTLQGDGLAWQSAIYKNDPGRLYFPYTRAFLDVSVVPSKQEKYLVVGGGAFTLPGSLERRYPQADIQVVEIDKSLLPVSERYFGFTPGPKLRVSNQDGRTYLNSNRTRYDVIYVDAFSNSTPPFQLLTREAAVRLRSAVADDGVVAMNILSKPSGAGAKYVASIVRTYGQVFNDVRVFRVDQTAGPDQPQNILLLAGRHSLKQAIQKLAASNDVFADSSYDYLIHGNARGIILTDDFAPVEQMAAAQE